MVKVETAISAIVLFLVGFVIYKFIKGDWRLPSWTEFWAGLFPKPPQTVEQYVSTTPLPEITHTATEAQYGGSRVIDPYLKTAPPSQSGQALSTEEILQAFPSISYEGAIEVRTYSRDPSFGLAGISTAAGQQYFRETGRYLPQ